MKKEILKEEILKILPSNDSGFFSEGTGLTIIQIYEWLKEKFEFTQEEFSEALSQLEKENKVLRNDFYIFEIRFVRNDEGFLARQFKKAEEDFNSWPEWMRREAKRAKEMIQ